MSKIEIKDWCSVCFGENVEERDGRALTSRLNFSEYL